MATDVELASKPASTSTVGVDIASVATAVPEHIITQDDAGVRAQTFFPHFARLEALYTNTGIDNRYSVEPMEWHLQPRTWEERTEVYQRNALDLLEQVADAGRRRSPASPSKTSTRSSPTRSPGCRSRAWRRD